MLEFGPMDPDDTLPNPIASTLPSPPPTEPPPEPDVSRETFLPDLADLGGEHLEDA